MSEREEFEKWVAGEPELLYGDRPPERSSHHGGYIYGPTHIAWEGWQARAESDRMLLKEIDRKIAMYVEEYGFTGEDQVDESDSWDRPKQKGYEWFKALNWMKGQMEK